MRQQGNQDTHSGFSFLDVTDGGLSATVGMAGGGQRFVGMAGGGQRSWSRDFGRGRERLGRDDLWIWGKILFNFFVIVLIYFGVQI